MPSSVFEGLNDVKKLKKTNKILEPPGCCFEEQQYFFLIKKKVITTVIGSVKDE